MTQPCGCNDAPVTAGCVAVVVFYLVSAQTSHVAGENGIAAQRHRQVVDRLREFRLETPSCDKIV